VVRGSVWDELAEALDEVDPEGGFELGELEGEPDFEPDADCELEEPDAPDWALDAPEVLFDLAPDVPGEPADLEAEEPDALLDDPAVPDADEFEDPDAGLAGVPRLTATSSGPFTPGPKYFAVRS
jgi:hypothetical protein